MTTRSPPRLATWLLEGIGAGAWGEELVGDLAEQYAAGRSRLWYWRQAGGAAVLSLRRTLLTHAFSFVAAVSAGCLLTSLWLFCNSLAFRPFYEGFGPGRHSTALEVLAPFVALRAAQISLTALAFVSGWIVTRIHRAHPRAVLLMFVLAVIAPRLAGAARLVADVVDGAPSSLLVSASAGTALQALITLAAGLWWIRKERFTDMSLHFRLMAVVTVVLTLGSTLLHDAWKLGVFAYPPIGRFTVDAFEIASVGYLARLLWCRAGSSVPARALV